MSRRDPNSNRPARPASTPAKRKGIPLTPLAQKMLQDLQLAGLGERTQESYLRAVRKFAQWLDKAPDQASEDDLRRYLLCIKNDQHWEANSLKVAYSGLKFFYAHTCPREWPTLQKLRSPQADQVADRADDRRSPAVAAHIRKPALLLLLVTDDHHDLPPPDHRRRGGGRGQDPGPHGPGPARRPRGPAAGRRPATPPDPQTPPTAAAQAEPREAEQG